MRITKVNIENEAVLMHRKVDKSQLVIGDKLNDETCNILPQKKIDSFRLSIINKTILKNDLLKKELLCAPCKKQRKLCYPCQEKRDKILGKSDKVSRSRTKGIADLLKDNLNAILNNEPKFTPIYATKDEINLCLGHKFRDKEVPYYLKDGQKKSFILADLILEANKNKQALQAYKDWADWYIETKSKFLEKSIRNNTVDIAIHPASPRKQALKLWEDAYLQNNDIDLSALEGIYEIEKLCSGWQAVPFIFENDRLRNRINFHLALKQALQQHQKHIFGTKESLKNRENIQLSIFNLEIVKYLEHYFPIKSSKRKQTSKADIEYYLQAGTIKDRIKKQLLNAIRLGMMNQGKAVVYTYDGETNSHTLAKNKTEEVFALKLIDACAFAGNNIRNIVAYQGKDDIIGKTTLSKHLEDTPIDAERTSQYLKLFLGKHDSIIKAENLTGLLWGIRGSVQKIRNEVIHFKKGSADIIFNVEKFEIYNEDKNYKDSLFKELLTTEKRNISAAIAEKLKSGGILTYYPKEVLAESLLKKLKFTLMQAVVPFAPGFKKVFKQGCNYMDKELKLKHYLASKVNAPAEEKETEKQYQARYFLIKLIYNHMFLSEFTENGSPKFKETANYVLEYNRKAAEKSGKKNKQAFKEIRPMKDSETVSDYMSYIQSQLIQEHEKKTDVCFQKEASMNFEKFLKQVFIKGFDNYLTENELDFIHQPRMQLTERITRQEEADQLNRLTLDIEAVCQSKQTGIDENNSAHIAFFTFAKLLDANHLSDLRNELIKYRQTVKSKNFAWVHLLEIIELCLLRVDACNNLTVDNSDAFIKEQAKLRTAFVEAGAKLEDWDDLFFQSDGQTPVLHAGMELAVKYDTHNVLKMLVEKGNFPLMKSDFDAWKRQKNTIQEKSERRQKLHEKWAMLEDKNKRTRNNEEKQYLSNKEKEEYKKLCYEIDQYNWLDNKLHFEHLRKMHLLLIDVLARMAGFTALFDRDFQLLDARRTADKFSLAGWVSLRNLSDEVSGKKKALQDIEDIENIIHRNTNHPVSEGDRNDLSKELLEKRSYYKEVFFAKDGGVDIFKLRNYIAHFNYLTTGADKYSLIDLINQLRKLLHYDRKLKNAVAKSFIDLFAKYGMELKLAIDRYTHELKIESIKPLAIYHLGTKAGKFEIKTEHVPVAFCSMCKQLLEMKK